jgi:hypothetical protein
MSTRQESEPRRELSDQERAAQIEELLNSEPLPMIEKSIDAFRRELPELLKKHRGQYVAYHGDERIGIDRSQISLYHKCFRRGLGRDDFLVCGIDQGVFDPDEEIEITSDV